MTNERAKLILSAYRPDGEDSSDPFFAEALEQARLDPSLGKWVAEQRLFEGTVRAALQSEQPPKELRDNLLHGNKVIVSMRPKRAMGFRWRGSLFLSALAASVLLFLGIGLLLHPKAPKLMSGPIFAQQVFQLLGKGQFTLGKTGGTTDELRAWLARNGSPHEFQIPDSLQDKPGVGCQTFLINGAKVSLICFSLEKNKIVHLFIIDQDALRERPGRLPSILHEGNKVAATWSANGRTYLLASTDIDEATLRQLI